VLKDNLRAARITARSAFLVAGKCAVAGGLLAYLAHKGNLQFQHLRLSRDSLPFLALGAGLILVVLVAGPLRHYVLLRALGVCIPYLEMLKIGLIGGFFNNFLLGSVGGDVVRYAYVARGGSSRSAAAASTLADRVLGLLSIFALAALMLGIHYRQAMASDSLRRFAAAILGVTLAGVTSMVLGLAALPHFLPGGPVDRLVARVPGGPALLGLARALALYRLRLRDLAAAFALSMLIQGLTVLSIFMLGRASSVERPPTLPQVAFATPVAFVANSLPLPGGGLGAGEAAFDQALQYCSTTRETVVVGGAFVGLPLYLRGSSRNRPRGLNDCHCCQPGIPL
jgi:uncharacterized membrane protein YbhN (UPF0104 family)